MLVRVFRYLFRRAQDAPRTPGEQDLRKSIGCARRIVSAPPECTPAGPAGPQEHCSQRENFSPSGAPAGENIGENARFPPLS